MPGARKEKREEADAHKAERIVREELARRGWAEKKLERQPKSDRHKARIAGRLRREPTPALEPFTAAHAFGSLAPSFRPVMAGQKLFQPFQGLCAAAAGANR